MGQVVQIEILKEAVRRVQGSGPVDFSYREGVSCPVCEHHLKPNLMYVIRTMPWTGKCRERYHRCPKCGMRFKSVESQ